MAIIPYLSFNGRCEEAIEFYKKALGAQVGMLMRFKDSPEAPPPGAIPAGYDDKVMHASMTINGSTLMATDGGCSPGDTKFEGFSLSFNPKDEADADRIFAALSDGGKVGMPLGKTFFAKYFGVVTDRFGVSWMVIIEA